MTILEKYRANVVMDINLTKGSLADQSGNGNNATPTGFNTWGVWRKQRALGFGTGKYLTVTDNAALRSADYTLIAVGDYRTAVSNARLFSKRGATVNYELYISATGTQLGIYNGTTSSLLTTTIKDNRFIACRTANRQVPSFFIDGVNKGQGSAPLTANTTDTPNLILGNMSDGVSGPISSLNSRFIMMNTAAITDAEMAQLYEELMNEGGGLKSPSKGFVAKAQPIDSDCIIAFDMETKTPDGKIADLSGGGRHGTIVSPSAISNSKVTPLLDLATPLSTQITFPSLSFGTSWTLETVLSTTTFNHIIMGGSTADYPLFYNSTNLYNNFNGTLGILAPINNGFNLTGELNHIVVVRTTNDTTLYLNGVSQGAVAFAPNAVLASITSFTNTSYTFKGKAGYTRMYSTAKDSTWAVDRYNRFASNLNFKEDLKYTPVTTANLAAAGSPSIPNTDYSISTGTWKVIEDSTGKRKIVSVISGGVLSAPSKKAYGTWVFELGNGTPYIMIAKEKTSHPTAGQQSYIVYIGATGNVVLAKSLGGGGSNLMGTANGYCTGTNTYKFCLTRDFTGKFTLYIKGGQYPNWIKVDVTGGLGTNPATNNDITTANYFNLVSQTIGDNFGLVAHLEGVIDPTVNPNLIP